jgi:hypothetical protein
VTFSGNRAPVFFTVHDAAGTVLATIAHVERALLFQRSIDEAEDVRRVPDGEVVATKKRLKRPVYDWAWALKHEPERE